MGGAMSLVCRREIWIMTKYFQVEDGVVVKGPRDLPKSHANISGFHHLDGDLATLKGHGWLPEEVIGYVRRR